MEIKRVSQKFQIPNLQNFSGRFLYFLDLLKISRGHEIFPNVYLNWPTKIKSSHNLLNILKIADFHRFFD